MKMLHWHVDLENPIRAISLSKTVMNPNKTLPPMIVPIN